MKKWIKPQLVDLTVDKTKGSQCPENFDNEMVRTPFGIFCDKIKPDGSRAYTPGKGITGLVCVYHGDGKWCNYTAQQES